MERLPDNVRISVHPLSTIDGAAVNGVLYGTDSNEIVFCIMHPREFMASHYLVPELVSAGHAVWTQTSRSVGQDLRLEHETALLDVAAGLALLRRQFRRIVLIGNSGGASLYGFYNQQSLLAPHRRLEHSPGGRPVKLAQAEMPVADGIVLVSPHPGQGQLLLRCIDPAVIDEDDPMQSDPSLDFLDPANGYADGPQGSTYSANFDTRYREAQKKRVARIDERAREAIKVRMVARQRYRDDNSTEHRRFAMRSDIITVWRTDADLRCWDLALDPSDRLLGSVWGKDPFVTNFGVPGFGRLATPEAWLSTWSGLSSNADLFRTAASIEQPCLQVEYSGDNTVFPSDTDAIFAAIASTNKQRERFLGDHHGRSLAAGDKPGRIEAGAAIRRWVSATFHL